MLINKILTIFLLLLMLIPSTANALDTSYKPQSKAWVLHHSAQSKDDGNYVLIGIQHSTDLKNTQLIDIERIFNEFKPTLILLEGGYWPLTANRNEAISCCGNMGFLNYLAHQNKTKVDTWEGNSKKEALFVLDKTTPAELKTFYALRQVDQIMREKDPTNKMNFLLSSLGFPEKEYNLKTEPYNISQLNLMVSKISGSNLTWDNFTADTFFKLTNDDNLNTLNMIKKRVNKYRDNSAIKTIKNAINKHERVMILCGKLHFRPIMKAL